MRVRCPRCGHEFEVRLGGRRGRPKKDVDTARLLRLLSRFNNNKSVVARLLGVSRPTLYRILREKGLLDGGARAERRDEGKQKSRRGRSLVDGREAQAHRHRSRQRAGSRALLPNDLRRGREGAG
ncbi:hypothetical protein B6U99_01830 [Candidatus Geothermarchaeota archaeon ex4572_27]|nr:MAG: hypothetical protein B6U99_01830 [Candidatus Geothermarchaeota archaeon ex4572_27]